MVKVSHNRERVRLARVGEGSAAVNVSQMVVMGGSEVIRMGRGWYWLERGEVLIC